MRRDARLQPLLAVGAIAGALAAAGPAQAAPSVRLVAERAYSLQGYRVALQGQRVRFRGITTELAPGQRVAVRVRQGRRTLVRTVRTVQPVGSQGQFTVEVRATRPGRLRAFANAPGVAARSRAVDVILPRAGSGARGLRVRFLQHRLRELRYTLRLSGVYDGQTALAVLAWRKVRGLPRTYTASPGVFAGLARKRGRFRVRYPRHGKHVEVDLSNQVLALIDRTGHVFRVIPVSSGKASTPTVRGSFRVYWQDAGRNGVGMLHSNYFIGGYAIHGYPSVPTYPASHGCVRIPETFARFVMRWLDVGDRVDVYR